MVIKMNNALIRALENRGSDLARNINIQYFLSGASVVLDFTSSNTITVLTYQSSKGLEFDTVFIPDSWIERVVPIKYEDT